ncbi:MAG TPA: hypothetical protein VGA30_12415, partial [Actinomycetota bacterium]
MTRARPGATWALVVAIALLPLANLGPASAAATPGRQAVLFLVDGASFEQLLAIPQFKQLARSGGAALAATSERYRSDPGKVWTALGAGAAPTSSDRALLVRVLRANGVSVCAKAGGRWLTPPVHGLLSKLIGSEIDPPAACPGDPAGGRSLVVDDASREVSLSDAGAQLRRDLAVEGASPVLVIVVGVTVSPAMAERGDEVTPLVMARGEPDRLLRPNGPVRTLSSDTTRQDGLVANVDLAPTILGFFGLPIPSDMDGLTIKVNDAPAPFALHRRHLEHRRTRLAVWLSLLAFVVAAGLLGIAVVATLWRRGSIPSALGPPMRFVSLTGAALLVAIAVGGTLPHLTYAWVFPFLFLFPPALAWLSLAAGSRSTDRFGPFTFLGVVGLAVLALDAILGWRALRVPLYGGTMFDGARFYGLPNVFIPLLLGSALFVARTMVPFPGFLLLVAAALFAGFPSLGADVGGAITLFVAAGAWWVLRVRPRVGLREVVFVAGVTAVGLAAILLANRFLPGSPTHAARFVERNGGRLGQAFDEVRHRLGVGAHQVLTQPATLLPLVGLPVILGLVLARPAPLRQALELDPRWTTMVIVLIVASMAAYFANDTGASAAAPAFIYAMGGIVYPAMLVAERRGRTKARPSTPTGVRR